MRLPILLATLFACALSVSAQLATSVDEDSGNTVVVSVITDADGDPSVTRTLSTVTTIPTTATTTTTADAAEDTINNNVGQPAVVGVPASLCTTAGCPVKPTTYTQNGVLMTWTATTPNTPNPTWTSSGRILNAASYVTSVSTATAIATGAASPRYSPFPLGTLGDWSVMAAVAVVGGMVGAVAVL